MYGTAAPVHSRDPKKFQHQGIGTLLMEEAERIAREEHGSGRIAVISGTYERANKPITEINDLLMVRVLQQVLGLVTIIDDLATFSMGLIWSRIFCTMTSRLADLIRDFSCIKVIWAISFHVLK